MRAVLEQIRTQVPTLRTIRDKELHFRLHELRYVGLIRRQKDGAHGWYYWGDPSQLPLLDESASVRQVGTGSGGSYHAGKEEIDGHD